jgi:hypothetical protein
MNDKNYTLEELADIGAKASYDPKGNNIVIFTKAILDAIGYEFPKDEEREAFDAWANANNKLATTDQFEAWKAGREELRKNTKPEPAWILWHGGKCPLPENTKCEISSYDGKKAISEAGKWDWDHHGDGYDIVAYRIIE